MFTLVALVGPLLGWLQSTALAQTVAESLLLTGFLSSVHLLGLTLIVGSALVSSLRLIGVMLPASPVRSVTDPAGLGIWVGLTISVVTGVLLVAPRGPYAADNGFFQTKMLLLAAAVVVHATLYRRVTRRHDSTPMMLRLTGALGLSLWSGVAVAGCAYILLEY